MKTTSGLLVAFLLCGTVHAEAVLFGDCELRVDMKGFRVSTASADPGGKSVYLLSDDRKRGITLSVFMERVEVAGDSRACRTAYWSVAEKSPIPKENIKQYEFNDAAVVEWDAKIPGGQKNINAYLARGRIWVDVHISRLNVTDKSREELIAIARSAQLMPVCEATTLYVQGEELHRKGKYKEAAERLQQALDAHRKTPLDRSMWRNAVVSLALSHAFLGDLKKCREILEDGLKVDPVYPLFHYNLACYYAETGDMDNAIASLKRAFQYRDDINADRMMPNPRKDDSFKRYLGNPKFQETLKGLDG